MIFSATYLDHAADHHPAWERCRPAVRALFIRNVSILVGARDADGSALPVGAVVAYTPSGKTGDRQAGGTGHTLRLARTFRIPFVNLSPATDPLANRAGLRRFPTETADAVLDVYPVLPPLAANSEAHRARLSIRFHDHRALR